MGIKKFGRLAICYDSDDLCTDLIAVAAILGKHSRLRNSCAFVTHALKAVRIAFIIGIEVNDAAWSLSK